MLMVEDVALCKSLFFKEWKYKEKKMAKSVSYKERLRIRNFYNWVKDEQGVVKWAGGVQE
jgi:hypothetical protein